MKIKLFSITTVAMLALTSIIGCKKEYRPLAQEENDAKITMYSGGTLGIGEIHNLAMENAQYYEGFDFSTEESAYTSIRSYIHEFLSGFPEYYDGQIGEDDLLLINPETLMLSVATIDNQFIDLKNNNVISQTEFIALMELRTLVLNNASGILTNDEFYSELNSFNTQYNEQLKQMVIVPNCLALGLASCNYWLAENKLPPGGYTDEEGIPVKIAPIVANDLAGGIVGGALSAGGQYIKDGKVDGTKVAKDALKGAVLGSIGLVGKVAKGIGRLFK